MSLVNPYGKVSALGVNALIDVTPTITANSAYTSGNTIGGLMALTGAISQLGGSARLESLLLLDRANQKPGGTLFIFSRQPTIPGNWADKATPTPADDDLHVKAAIPVSVADWVSVNGRAFADVPYVGRLITGNDPANVALYAVFITTSTPTFSTNNDFRLRAHFSYAD